MPPLEDMRPGVYRRIFSGALTSRRLAMLKPLEAELLFWRIIMIADDYGRFRADPTSLLSTAFPLRPEIGVRKIKIWRDALVKAKVKKVGLIVLYQIDGEVFGYVVGWQEKQTTRSGRRVMKFPAPKTSGKRRKLAASGGNRRKPRGSRGKPVRSGGVPGPSSSSSSSSSIPSSSPSSIPIPIPRSNPSRSSSVSAPPPVLGHAQSQEAGDGGGSGSLGDEEKRIQGFGVCDVCEKSGEYAGAVVRRDGSGSVTAIVRVCACPRGENRQAARASVRRHTEAEETRREERDRRGPTEPMGLGDILNKAREESDGRGS